MFNRPLQRLVIWGASGHARVAAEIIRMSGAYELIGFIDSVNPARKGEVFSGAPILGGEETVAELMSLEVSTVFVAFGANQARIKLAYQLQDAGFALATAIHPTAIVSPGVTVAAGTLIAAGAIVNPGTVIGECVILNTGAIVDHDCVLAPAAHISPGCRLGGTVDVGETTWIGIGSTVIDHIRIGAHSVIGAGSVVVDNIPDGVIAFGVPARIQRKAD